MAEQTTVRVKTTGMHCQSCAMLVQMNVEELPGVASVKVDVAGEATDVTYDPGAVTVDQIVGAITSAGYGASVEA